MLFEHARGQGRAPAASLTLAENLLPVGLAASMFTSSARHR